MPAQPVMRRSEKRFVKQKAKRGKIFITFLLVLALFVAILYFITRYPQDVEKIAYPLKYVDLIRTYASENGLEDAHVAAVIYCESSFKEDAVSVVDARGLMQIMPETGAWIAEKLGETVDYSAEKLFEPERNIRYGCWYLGYLSRRFDGDMTKIMAAYHAGGSRVDEWLKNPAYSFDGKTLDSIPIEQTRKYVTHIAAVYPKYKELMKDEAA